MHPCELILVCSFVPVCVLNVCLQLSCSARTFAEAENRGRFVCAGYAREAVAARARVA